MSSDPDNSVVNQTHYANQPDYIVGIGASAGGLEALEQFIKKMQTPSGLAFVIVQHLSPDYKKLIRVTEDLQQPNGIIGTPDGKKLYVADIKAGKTYVYDINLDGTLKNKKLFCSLGSDGMTIDCCGNIYLTGDGVIVFNSKGKQIEHIKVPQNWTANVCFGGADRQTLFITASKGLYTLRMNTHRGDRLK